MEKRSKFMDINCQNASDNPSYGRDRLSELPEKIIFNVFSFLGANETVHLRAVSKRFKQLCEDSPYLHFHVDFNNVASYVSKRKKYEQFCSYVDSKLRMRSALDRLVLHWIEDESRGGSFVVDSWINLATKCKVKELDIAISVECWKSYSLSDHVHRCESLRSLRLNLQDSKLHLMPTYSRFIEDFSLESLTISAFVLPRINGYWTSLKRLNLVNVAGIGEHIDMRIPSLQELTMKDCMINAAFRLSVSASSFSVLVVSDCSFQAECHFIVGCATLDKFAIHACLFRETCMFETTSTSTIENMEVSECGFRKESRFLVVAQSIKHLKMNHCKFADDCNINTKSTSSIDQLTVSRLEFITPTRPSQHSYQNRINFEGQSLQSMAINTTSKCHVSEFPLAIYAPNLKDLRWTGNPVDFVYLERFVLVENAAMNIRPACRHKRTECDQRCKLFKSLTCSVSTLFEVLSRVKSLTINSWPIEIFFMENEKPVCFGNLRHLHLVIDGLLADQLPCIASFVKGAPNLLTLTLQCAHKYSSALSDPNLTELLELDPKRFVPSVKIKESQND